MKDFQNDNERHKIAELGDWVTLYSYEGNTVFDHLLDEPISVLTELCLGKEVYRKKPKSKEKCWKTEWDAKKKTAHKR